MSGESEVRKAELTFVLLLLDFDLHRRILLDLLFYLSPNLPAIHRIAQIADLLEVHVIFSTTSCSKHRLIGIQTRAS